MAIMQYVELFESISLINKIKCIYMAETLITIFSLFTFFPIIFNFKIIPRIEKIVGEKLIYTHIVYQMTPFGTYCRYLVDIVPYIMVKHIAYLFGFDPNKVRVGNKSYALQRVNYDIKNVSRFELFLCYLACVIIIQMFTFTTIWPHL